MGNNNIKYMTGIRPSVPKGSNGNSGSEQSLHIGNYFGAIEDFINLKGEKQFLVADSSTLSGSSKFLDAINIVRSTAAYCALGVLSDGGYMYLQSGGGDNKYFYELYTLLNSFTNTKDILIELERRKTIEGKTYNIHDLDCLDFSYPNHMAADIILANPDAIPVGESNRGNIEYAQRLIQQLNNQISDNSQRISIPDILLSDDIDRQNILGTDGGIAKMSKSDNNYLSVFVTQEERKKEINKIVSLDVSQYLLKIIDPTCGTSNDLNSNKMKIFELLEDKFRDKNKIYDEIKDDKKYIYGLLNEGNRRHGEGAKKIMNTIRSIFFKGYDAECYTY